MAIIKMMTSWSLSFLRSLALAITAFSLLSLLWSIDSNEQLIRTIRKGELWEISPVVFPAYPQTEVGLRGQQGLEAMPTMPDWVRAHLVGKGTIAEPVRAHQVQRRRLELLERI